MAINQSKVRSHHQWNKWLRSGAVSGVRLEWVGKFEMLRFTEDNPTTTIERVPYIGVPYIGFDDGKLHLSWSAPNENWGTSRFLTTM